jgi:signal transduction histidine kinase
VDVGASEVDGFFEFWVTDNGPGIAPQYHERIWSLFQRLESQEQIEGTGVGLALVKKIVEGQGGRAWVESQPGQGATFRFLWPRLPAPPAVAAPEVMLAAELSRAPRQQEAPAPASRRFTEA